MSLISAGSISLDSTFKRLLEDGGGRIFLKTFLNALFNEDISNEPLFGQIHLAGQYTFNVNQLYWTA